MGRLHANELTVLAPNATRLYFGLFHVTLAFFPIPFLYQNKTKRRFWRNFYALFFKLVTTLYSFADDSNLFFCHKSLVCLEKIINTELAHVETWLNTNKLS